MAERNCSCGVVAGILVLALVGCTAPQQQPQPLNSYALAIDALGQDANSNARPELEGCVRNWRTDDTKRREAEQFFSGPAKHAEADEFRLLLEIGNSSFLKYQYVAIVGSHIRTQSSTDETAGSALLELIDKLGPQEILAFRGNASLNVFDGDCYFLTIVRGKASMQIAMYGIMPSTLEGRLISELTHLARRTANQSP